ncbi:MAG: anti-sigma factor family protein [Roseinatronobacter sp.]
MTEPAPDAMAVDIALDPDLIAYADGALSPAQMAEIEARLAHDPAAREAVAQWRHLSNLLNTYAAEIDDAPENLKIAALERQLAQKLLRNRLRSMITVTALRNVAAGGLLFAAGWWGNSYYNDTVSGVRLAQPSFLAPTLAGHLAYANALPERSDYYGTDIQLAMDWMTEQMQRKIDSPQLERLGYRVESARILMVEDRPLVVFNYRDADNQQITVSMTPHARSQPDYALRVADISNQRTAYWSSEGMNYTVVSDRASLPITTIAAAVQN